MIEKTKQEDISNEEFVSYVDANQEMVAKDNTLYLECYSGISGDMLVATLLDLGAREQVLGDVLQSLPLEGFEVKIKRVKKSGIDACDFNVVLAQENHDHDMDYLYGHNHEINHEHHDVHSHYHEHNHMADKDSDTIENHNHDNDYHQNSRNDHHNDYHYDSQNEHYNHHHHDYQNNHHDAYDKQHHHHDSHHTHHHEHRGMKEITAIIQAGNMTEGARKTALDIFDILARAEAKAHNTSYEEVHFHEVGAVDSIIDIIAIAVCLDDLGITDVIVPCLYEGMGTVRCQHGILPVPVPAVINIIKDHGLKLQIKPMEGEYITPTGAATVAAVITRDSLPEHFVVKKVGVGAGKRVYDGPGIMRGMIIEE
ncbi:MAG: LarC family nickel insertion protein [Lachnospiraceae bacterium]